MMLLQLAAAVLLFEINGYLCQEKVCIYIDVNLCPNCTTSLHVRNISVIPEGDGLIIYFCSTRIILDTEMIFEDRANIGIIGAPGGSIECIRNTSAGILFSNVTNIKIEKLVLFIIPRQGCPVVLMNCHQKDQHFHI